MRAPVYEVAVEDVRDGLHVAAAVGRKAVVRKQEKQVPQLAWQVEAREGKLVRL